MVRVLLKTWLLIAALTGSTASNALAQSWPARPVTILVPFTAGGSTDIVARLMAERLRSVFNGSFVIENKVGASGNLGVVAAARAAPDGYTLLFSTSGPVATNVLTFKSPPIDQDLPARAAITLIWALTFVT